MLDLQSCIELVKSDIQRIMDWSKQSILIFNSKKTKTIVFSTPQVSKINNLRYSSIYALITFGKTLERVKG